MNSLQISGSRVYYKHSRMWFSCIWKTQIHIFCWCFVFAFLGLFVNESFLWCSDFQALVHQCNCPRQSGRDWRKVRNLVWILPLKNLRKWSESTLIIFQARWGKTKVWEHLERTFWPAKLEKKQKEDYLDYIYYECLDTLRVSLVLGPCWMSEVCQFIIARWWLWVIMSLQNL